ncbi:MAG: enoyl-CoA hydratase-related protein [Polyangiaceae bacterium]|nr:enoyl-CoA hydratase-related protein [Polyangiaceae bacterium]
METPPVTLELDGRVAWVTLRRPARMNALSRAMVLELGTIGRELATHAKLRAILLTGEGDKAFCAGADLKERAGMSDDEVRAQLNLYRTELNWLDSSRVPVVAVINGAALGGGLELALMCDLRIAAGHASLGLPETSLGIIPAAGGTQRLPRIIGEGRAKQLILRAERLTAEEALQIGLVNHVVPHGSDLRAEALAWIAPLLNGAPLAQAAALTAIEASHTLPITEGLEVERQAYEACLTSADRREALTAFSEKRKPVFRGV